MPAAAAGGAPPPVQPPTADVRLLLFNCMHEREPRRLLAPLTATLAERGTPLGGALFVPPDSSYAKLGPAEAADVSWQVGLQQVWTDLDPPRPPAGGARLPPLPSPTPVTDVAAGAVAPSVRSAVDWLRSATRSRPGLRMKVLVTGSLYLVGDVLRHLGRADE